MTMAYSNGVAVFGSTDLDSLASSTTLVAGWESAVITNSVDTHLLSGRFKANNTAPTSGVLEVWVVPAWDIAGSTTYPDVFDGTSSAETVTYRNVLRQSGRLAANFETDATANKVYEFSQIDIGALFQTMPKKYVVFVVHNMVQALNATASNGGQCWYEPVTY
jgi:hypothetical protein